MTGRSTQGREQQKNNIRSFILFLNRMDSLGLHDAVMDRLEKEMVEELKLMRWADGPIPC